MPKVLEYAPLLVSGSGVRSKSTGNTSMARVGLRPHKTFHLKYYPQEFGLPAQPSQMRSQSKVSIIQDCFLPTAGTAIIQGELLGEDSVPPRNTL
jgi:hypothetical protein